MAFQLVATPHIIARNAGALYDFAAGNAFMGSLVSQATANPELLNQVYANSVGPASTTLVADTLIANLGITGDSAVSVAKDYIVATLDGTPLEERGDAVDEMLLLFSHLTEDAVFGAAAIAWNEKVQKAVDYAAHPGSVDSSFSSVVADITEGSTYDLTVAQDNMIGTAFADMFIANVVQNINGEQTNELATGDTLNGGAGHDELWAKVQPASSLNAAPGASIDIESVDVEEAWFTALDSGSAILGNDETVIINAKDMLGLDLTGSYQSDASLLIENLTTLTDSGAYEDRRNTEDVVIRMDHAGNALAVDKESDMTVLFDNDYLVAGQSSLSEAFYWLLDEKAELEGNPNRLENIDTDGLRFTIDGVEYRIASEAARLAGTHEGFVAELQTVLQEEQAAGNIPSSVSIRLDYGIIDDTGLDDGSISGAIPAIVLSTTEGQLDPIGFSKPGDLTGDYDVYGQFDNAFERSNDPITATVELEKVGRGAEGGDLTIGGMATDLENSWDYSASAINEGISVFNITVSGDDTQDSSLASLQSTNNTLEVVNVVSVEGSEADLYIGNKHTVEDSNTGNDNAGALKDVRIFNASTFVNDLSLTAGLTEEVTAKYMDLKDDQGNPAADNIDFHYTTGAGNDSIDLSLSAANLAKAGTTTREDFELTVMTGDGDDVVVQKIIDEVIDGADVLAAPDFWYTNSKMNANLDIDTGAGDDTVWTPGSGDVVINVGDGNDAVYTDNSGVVAAAWVVSAQNADLNNLEGNPANNAPRFLYNGTLTVTFTGAQIALAGGITSPDADAYDNGWEATASIPTGDNYAVTQLHINQAIKDAINNDSALNKLLVAEDGPGNTLVISSLIDGAFDADDLVIDISAPGISANNTAAINAYRAFAGNSQATSTDASAANAASVTALEAREGMGLNQVLAANGTASSAHTDNIVDLGSGDDVLVMSTSANSEDILEVTGADIGVNTIVNFAVTGAGSDFIDFTDYLTSMTSPTGSSVSAGLIGITLEDASGEPTPTVTFDANEVAVMRFFGVAGETFTGLSADKLQAIINATQTSDATTWGNLHGANLLANDEYDASSTGAGDPIALVNGAAKAVVMVENAANLGEYKTFELSWNGASSNDDNGSANGQVTVNELGILDFGHSLTGLTDANLVDGVNYTGPAGFGGVTPPPVGPTTVDLAEGTTAPVIANNAIEEIFTFDVAAALALTDNTQISLSSFDVVNDALQIDSITALGNTTLDQLNGVDGIAVQSNPITQETLINFGNDADGDVVTLSLTGITDPALINIEVI